MHEFERVEKLRARLGSVGSGVELGIGDDAAVVRLDGSAVLSNDASIEGVHFRRSFGRLDRLTRRALHAAASDLAAMGAEPVAMLVALALPRTLDESDFDAIVEGMRQASLDLGMPVVGGNLSAASEIGITTTVVGRAVATPLRRSGARVGDTIYVSGCVGAAALGLRALLQGGSAPDDAFVAAWLDVRARIELGRALRGVASAAVDVSDGLSQDLLHLLDASGVGATLRASALPLAASATERAAELGVDALELALTGGEDYELLFTAPADSVARELGTAIGCVEARPGLRVDRGDGPRAYVSRGHRHFERGDQS